MRGSLVLSCSISREYASRTAWESTVQHRWCARLTSKDMQGEAGRLHRWRRETCITFVSVEYAQVTLP